MPDALLKVALLGTSNAPLPPAEHPADDVSAASARELTSEEALLLRAAARSAYDATGVKPQPLAEIAPECPIPTQTVGSPEIARILSDAIALSDLRQRPSPLVVALLRQMAAADVTLPHELLPRLLKATGEAIRAELRPLLGVRGRYLAMLNPKWAWATTRPVEAAIDLSSAQETFATSPIDEQVAMLDAVRKVDPAVGRNLFEDVFASEPGKNRVRLIQSLEAGLEPADEALLESALKDRAGGVRQVATDLLARLPESAFASRIRRRAETMLSLTPADPKRGRPAAVVCEPPDPLPEMSFEDGLSPAERRSFGKTDVFVLATLRFVPPSVWSDRFGLTPDELFTAATGMYDGAIVTGWIAAAVLHRDREWLAAAASRLDDFLSAGTVRTDRATLLGQIIAAMSWVDRERAILDAIGSGAEISGAGIDNLMVDLDCEQSPNWSRRFLTRVVDGLAKEIRRSGGLQSGTVGWIEFASVALMGVPFADLPNDIDEICSAVASIADPRGDYGLQVVDNLESQVRLRHRFQAELDRITAAT